QRLWILAQLTMAVGVALPAWRQGMAGILVAALLVGGTFMMITQAGMQEARALTGPRSARLMAAMTSAFAAGQVAGPLAVTFLAGGESALSRPLLAASLVLLTSAVTLMRCRGSGPSVT